LLRRRYVRGALWLAVAALVGLWYGGTDSLPAQVVTATPYLTTLVVLALASQRLRPPKADGLIYRRGEE
nr:hypothetical protein [Micromonospora sp. DSM 115978]